MSAVGTIAKIATNVAGKAAHAVIHPRATAASVTGHARDLASTVTGGESRSKAEPSSGSSGEPSAGKARPKAAPAEPTVVPKPPTNTEPAESIEPREGVEPSTTEPKAASRQAAHQGRGADPTDDWHDELDELDDGSDINPATGQPHNTPGADEPLLDPGVAKAIRSEAETMERAADPDKG